MALPRGSPTAEGTSVLQGTPTVRAEGSAGGLGRRLQPRAIQARGEGGSDDEVLGFLRAGLCTAAYKLTRGLPASASGAERCRSEVSALGSRSSRPEVGNRPRQARLVKARLVWGSVARTVCPGSVLVAEVSKWRRAQRSRSGCGRGGGRGPSSRVGNHAERSGVEIPVGRKARRRKGLRRVSCWWKALRTTETVHLHGWAAEGVSARRIARLKLWHQRATGASELRCSSGRPRSTAAPVRGAAGQSGSGRRESLDSSACQAPKARRDSGARL